MIEMWVLLFISHPLLIKEDSDLDYIDSHPPPPSKEDIVLLDQLTN